MQTIYGEDKLLLEWAQKRLVLQFRADARTIGRAYDDGSIAAVVIFDGFSRCDANIHVVSDERKQWLSREFLVRVFAYPFIQCNLTRLTGLTPARNLDALKLNQHLGFEYEGRCRQAMPDGDDLIVTGLLKQSCRYIAKQYRAA